MSLGIAATAIGDHGPVIDLTSLNANVTHNGAVFIQGGTGAGTGNYDPFLQVQETGGGADGVEKGYNTEPNVNGEFDTKSIPAGNTHKLEVASIPVVEYNSGLYREFSLDANESGDDPFMSIDEIKLFIDDQFALTGYNEVLETFSNDLGPTFATKIYDLDAGGNTTVLTETQTLEPGSGVSDITVLVPNEIFPENCYYGSLECDLYLIFWTVKGGYVDASDTDWDAQTGFEEWRVRRQPVVNVTKTADPTVTITHDWDITKTVNPETHDGFAGGTAGTSTWTVVVDETETTSNETVSGIIKITNPTDPALGVFDDPEPAVIESVEDVITQVAVDTSVTVTPVTVTCPETFPFTLGAGDDLECTYTQVVPNADSGTNTATVTISDGTDDFESTHIGTADFDFADAEITDVGPTSVTVDDDREDGTNFPDIGVDGDITYNYDETFDCSSTPGDYTEGVDTDQYVNIATLADDQVVFDQDNASVTVTCYLPGVSKTANGTNDETHTWTIDKDPDATYKLFAGESQDHIYTITLDETVIENNFVVAGTITVTNPNPSSAVTVDLSDQLSDGTAVDLTECDDDAVADGVQFDVAANDSRDCPYSVNDADGNATANIATITINGVTQQDNVAFTYVPNVTNPSINVTDDNGTPGTEPADTADDRTFGPFTDDDSDGYTQTFDCSTTVDDYANGTYQYTVVNTASIDETAASDIATVVVNCYLPDVSKTATGSYDEIHTWDITKTADATYSLVAGDSTNHSYTITVDETVTDAGFTVSGAVTVSNPHPSDAALVTLTDQLSDGTSVAFIDCADEAGDAGIQVTVPANGSKVCSYSVAEAGDDGDAVSNTVTMTFNGTSQSDTELFAYQANVTGPTQVNVTDDNGSADAADDTSFGPFTGDGSAGYDRAFACSADTSLYTNGTYQYQVVNTATIDETGANDDATVTVNCYLPVVTKTAQTSFTRTFNWVIEKDALLADGTSIPATGIELAFGQSYNLEWKIIVDLDETDPVTDSAPAFAGVVTVANPASVGGPAMTVDVTDLFTPDVGSGVAIAVDCDPVTDGAQNTGIVIAAASSVDCSYSLSTDGTSNKTNGTNVATATLSTGASSTGSAAVDFNDNAATITEVDATVIVTDTFNGATEILGSASVWAGELPKSFSYFTLLSSDATTPELDLFLECGEQTILNRADVNTDVNSGPGVSLAFATREVLVTVDCDLGCTLTQGYWKTHNDSFWGGAPTDDTWMLIGDADGDGVFEAEEEEFFLSGQTWFEVFWTPPKGNAYYNLAHQWMAATLNTLNGASTTAEVDAALAGAGGWLAGITPADAADLKGRDAKFVRDWASTLDDYNNGLIGPGHCDEDAFSKI